MIKKIIVLFCLFLLGFVFGLKADNIGFNSLRFKQNLDAEIDKLKGAVVTFGESFNGDGWFMEVLGDIIIFVGTWAEWIFLLYVIIVVARMVIVYLR